MYQSLCCFSPIMSLMPHSTQVFEEEATTISFMFLGMLGMGNLQAVKVGADKV